MLAPYLWLFCLVYIDDVVVYSTSYEKHLDHLDQVLGAIEKAGLTLSPTKCHLFYPSIVLLGHKVSRLGLSTHEEKVKAVLELERPSKVSQLQTFLGMLVYFSAFIPHYASTCAPLFQLLRKGAKWDWTREHEQAFEEGKQALASAPVLAHPERGRPYRLYTDASDEAIGCSLQQVQLISVGDLKGTKSYARIQAEYDAGRPPPKLVNQVPSKFDPPKTPSPAWGPTLNDSEIEVERVIAYWSRTLKDAERRYSTTEREALAAKEGLIKFQPFIEGEKVTLVTDHTALQWAKMYENSNRRLASWSTVFSAFAPHLEIVHRPGRVHSNVDPLSRLKRHAPGNISPPAGVEPTLSFTSKVEEEHPFRPPKARRVTAALVTLEDILEIKEGYTVHTRSKSAKKEAIEEPKKEETTSNPSDGSSSSESHLKEDYSAGSSRPPSVIIAMDTVEVQSWVEAYRYDAAFKTKYEAASDEQTDWSASHRYFKDSDGLLYFRDADFKPKLCVPSNKRTEILVDAHESPFETAHSGPEKLWTYLSARFFWPRMGKDIKRFVFSCDICQKTKNRNFGRYGTLIPNPIPRRPYESISMDFIVNLPKSGSFNAVWVVVDRFTKHAQFVPITTGLTTADFAELFVRRVASRFGLPDSIVSDRDARWTSEFWKNVSSALHIRLAMSSAHHPQHDGQTEIVNRTLETMLRAYTSQSKASWANWLHLMEFAYNSTSHSSTGYSPFLLLYGFEPKKALDYVGRTHDERSNRSQAGEFLSEIRLHREIARQAIAKAQEKQAATYNKGRRPCEFYPGDLVLVNPHELEWSESKGEGAKLVQRWIGPFEVTERINPKTYRLRLDDRYPGSPVFNLEHLQRYIISPEDLGARSQLPDTRTQAPSEEYEIDKIVGHKLGARRKIQYLIRWKGCSPMQDTWQTERDLCNAAELLRDYKRTAKL